VQSYEAELGALAAFGTVDDLVPRESQRIRVPLRRLAGQVLNSAMLLGAIGAMTVGASGVVAGLIYLIGGANSITAVPTTVLTPQNCARWLSQQAGTNCHQAALSDWAFETVYARLALGLAGVLLLIAYRSCKRRWTGNSGLTPIVTDTAATLAFAVAGLWTAGLGVDAMIVSGGQGAGQWLSAAPIALAATAVYCTRLVKHIRELPAR
jgi:hypothetical protein